MPQIGLCNDLKCDKESKQLYECHCCLHLVCFNHLIEHVEITKRDQEEFNRLSQQLSTDTNALQLIIEKKLIDIEREKKLIQLANHFLNIEICPIDQIESILKDVNQALVTNRQQETILKVESSLSDTTSCIFKNFNEKTKQNDELSIEYNQPDSKSFICLDLTEDLNQSEISIMTKENKYPLHSDRQFFQNFSLDSTQENNDDNESEEQIKYRSSAITGYIGRCPLTFDGAFGLTERNHSVRFCSNKKQLREIGLYAHFMGKHELQTIHAKRLIEAIRNNKDPITTKLFDDNQDVINHNYKIQCPFNKGMINLRGFNQKNILRVPCRSPTIPGHTLKFHLKHYHKVSAQLARILVTHYKDVSPRNNLIHH